MNSKSIFSLVYRLLGLASLAWGLYQLAFVPYSIASLMHDHELSFTFSAAFLNCWAQIVLNGVFVFYGLFSLHFSPKILAFLYREE